MKNTFTAIAVATMLGISTTTIAPPAQAITWEEAVKLYQIWTRYYNELQQNFGNTPAPPVEEDVPELPPEN
jgi:hypothetical protein